jgi:uncharacterized membrane protein YgaE (UPF0421/DUF939 family)
LLLNKYLNKFIDIERLIHSVKTAIACMIAYILMQILGPFGNQWIVITVIVVMCSQIYVGSVLQKSYLRVLGTLAGCLFTAFVLISFGFDETIIGISLGIAAFIFSYLATSKESLSYTGTLGAVTTVIILLDKHPTFLLVFQRFVEICIGILIAGLVSQFILPIHARSHLRRTQAMTLSELRDYYINIIINFDSSKFNPQELEENIVKTILKQRQLAKESKNESINKLQFNIEEFSESLLYEREILRAMVFMHYAKDALIEMKSSFLSLPQLLNYHEKNKQALDVLIKVIENNKIIEKSIYLPTLSGLKNLLDEQHQYSEVELNYIHVFLFSADIFSTRLGKLAKLYGVRGISENVEKNQ